MIDPPQSDLKDNASYEFWILDTRLRLFFVPHGEKLKSASRTKLILFPFLNIQSANRVSYHLQLILWLANYQLYGFVSTNSANGSIGDTEPCSNHIRPTCLVARNVAPSFWYLVWNLSNHCWPKTTHPSFRAKTFVARCCHQVYLIMAMDYPMGTLSETKSTYTDLSFL